MGRKIQGFMVDPWPVLMLSERSTTPYNQPQHSCQIATSWFTEISHGGTRNLFSYLSLLAEYNNLSQVS